MKGEQIKAWVDQPKLYPEYLKYHRFAEGKLNESLIEFKYIYNLRTVDSWNTLRAMDKNHSDLHRLKKIGDKIKKIWKTRPHATKRVSKSKWPSAKDARKQRLADDQNAREQIPVGDS